MVQDQLGVGLVLGDADDQIAAALPNDCLVDLCYFLGDIAGELGPKLGNVGLSGGLGGGCVLGLCQGQQRHFVGVIAAAQPELDLGAFGQVRKVKLGAFAHIGQVIGESQLVQQGLDQGGAVIIFRGVGLGDAGGEAQRHGSQKEQCGQFFCHFLHSLYLVCFSGTGEGMVRPLISYGEIFHLISYPKICSFASA